MYAGMNQTAGPFRSLVEDKSLLEEWRVVAERLRPSDSNSGVSDQQSMGSSPSRDTCVLKQDT